jgi:glycosyltransferase involved in cell wall biosynthesis
MVAIHVSASRTFLFYTHSLSGGGAERAWSLLASGLARRGHSVIFAVDYEAEQNLTYLVPGVRVVILEGGHATTVVKLARLIAETRPDVTVSALCFSNLKHVLAATIAGRRQNAVISYHSFSGGEPQLLSRFAYALTALQTRLAARTIAVSDALRTELVTRWRSPAHKTVRIYNPVVWGETNPQLTREDILARPPLVLASGRLVNGKNFAALLRAFAQLENQDARLVILGEGVDRHALEKQIRSLGLRQRVRLPGYVTSPWNYYAEASCLVSPSRTESFGMVVVEAMAHGLPIVTTPTLGPVEIIDNGRLGLLVPHDDEHALAKSIDAALKDPGDPRPRIEHAQKFSAEVAIDAYALLAEEVICESAPGPARALLAGLLGSGLGF